MIVKNLPVPVTSFIGREAEIAQIMALLSTTRLLTLTGAGGCGETRLALQVAHELQAGDQPTIGWVELAALADPALVAQNVAAALGIREEPDQPLDVVLATALRARTLLLVLDNCEHLVSACAALVEKLLWAEISSIPPAPRSPGPVSTGPPGRQSLAPGPQAAPASLSNRIGKQTPLSVTWRPARPGSGPGAA